MINKFLYKKEKNFIKKKELADIDFNQLELANAYFYKTNSSVDDITWNDLDMKNIFSKLNYTVTTPGEEQLYSWLRNPVDNKNELEDRMYFINKFKMQDTIVHKLRIHLSAIKYCKYNYREIMESAFLVNNLMLIVFIILALINLGIIAYSISIMKYFALPVLVLITVVNMILHFKFSIRYGLQLQVLSYTLKILSFSRKSKKLLE